MCKIKYNIAINKPQVAAELADDWRTTSIDVAALNRTHSLNYLKEGVCNNESRKTESLYGWIQGIGGKASQ